MSLNLETQEQLDNHNRAVELHNLKLRIAKLEPIVDLAAKWYLAGTPQEGVNQAQLDLEDALHTYLELT